MVGADGDGLDGVGLTPSRDRSTDTGKWSTRSFHCVPLVFTLQGVRSPAAIMRSHTRKVSRARNGSCTSRCMPRGSTRYRLTEIVFSIIQRKVIKPADFADLDALADRLRRFEDRYNETAAPFDWRFTTADLTAMLERVGTQTENQEPLAA